MATAFTQTYRYRDPEKIDISVLGNAAKYKQNLYDTNVAQTQQLINQYAGTDLLKDVDKQYFGERLNTLVNYINQSGTRDWSRRSIANEIQSHVSTALDKNVMNAIASTQSFRKQQAEIEDIRKNKPEQYSMQNEWFAKRDLQRYMESTEVGDVYNAQPYTPYTDLSKEILKNSDFFKQFGAEVKYDPISGNAFFQHIGKKEIFSPEKARNMIAMAIGEKGKQQMMIDGLYQYKDKSKDEVRQDFVNTLNSQKDEYMRLSKTSSIMAAGASNKEKEAYTQQSKYYSDRAGEVSKNIIDSESMSSDAMVYTMHSNNFLNQWGKAMSYEKITDLIIDDSGYKTANFNWEVKTDIWEQNYKLNKDIVDAAKDQRDYDLKVKIAQAEGKLDENGNTIIGGSQSNADKEGYSINDIPKDSGIIEEKNPIKIVNDYVNDYNTAVSSVEKDIQNLKSTPEGQERLRNIFGSESKASAGRLAWLMIQGNKLSQERYSDMKKTGVLSESSIASIDKAQSSYKAKQFVDKETDKLLYRIDGMLKTTIGNPNVKDFGGLTEYVVDVKGNVVKGNYVDKTVINPGLNNRTIVKSNSKGFDHLSNYSKIGARLGMIQSLLRESAGNTGELTENQKNELRVLSNNLIAKLPKDQQDKARSAYNTEEQGFWSAIGNAVLSTGVAFKGAYYDIKSRWTNDDQDKAKFQEAQKEYDKYSRKVDAGMANIGLKTWQDDINIDTYDMEDLDSHEMNNKVGRDSNGYLKNGKSLLTEFKTTAGLIDENIQKYNNYYSPTSITVDLNKSLGKEISANLMALVPDKEIVKDMPAQFTINPDTKTASVSMSIKAGKGETERIVIEDVPMQNLPSKLTSKLNMDANRFKYDTDLNPNPESFYFRGDIFDNSNQISAKYKHSELNPEENHFTKADIKNQLEIIKGKDFIKEHSEKIEKILDNSVSFEGTPVSGQGMYALRMYLDDGTQIGQTSVIDPIRVNDIKTEMERLSDKIASEKIIEHIIKTIK